MFRNIKLVFKVILFFFINKNRISSKEWEIFLKLINGYVVKKGPFKGMKYIKKSNGSVLMPKLLGIYEYEIQQKIEEIINSDYENIIDVGCAEGYYAVGFAYRISKKRTNFNIYAYDLDELAINNLLKLAKLNGLESFLTTGKLLDHCSISKYNGKTIIFCDIEGNEIELLNPQKAPNLYDMDILVEIHDKNLINGEIKNVIYKRFINTHEIEVILHKKFNNRLFKIIPQEIEKIIIDEKRVKGLQWLWIKKKRI